MLDLTFGLNSQALAVMQFLAGMDPDFADYKNGQYRVRFETHPWRNGRESGFSLMMQREIGSPCIYLAVFEHRNSDAICVLKWEQDDPFYNGPTIENAGKLAYLTGNNYNDIAADFAMGDIGGCASWIYDTLTVFYRENENKKASNEN